MCLDVKCLVVNLQTLVKKLTSTLIWHDIEKDTKKHYYISCRRMFIFHDMTSGQEEYRLTKQINMFR